MAGNEVGIKSSAMLVYTNDVLQELGNYAKSTQIEFTDYQKTCVANAIRTIDPMLTKNGYSWNDFEPNNVMLVLQQTAFLNLNASAQPRECYYIVRKNYDKQNKKYLAPTLEFGIEGAGNDAILRNFGVDVKEIKSYIVYKGDDFQNGYMDGFDWVLPKYTRTFETSIPEKAVYLIKHFNGSIDVAYATTDDVKKSLFASAKQNGAPSELLRSLEDRDLYDLLKDEELLKMEITNSWGGKAPLFNPSYTEPQSRDNMIERKLRNHATRKYPKNFNITEVEKLYEETFEEKYRDGKLVVDAEQHVQIAQETFNKESGKKDLFAKEDGLEKEPLPTQEDPYENVGEPITFEEEVEPIEEEPQEKQVEKTVVEHKETSGASNPSTVRKPTFNLPKK